MSGSRTSGGSPAAQKLNKPARFSRDAPALHIHRSRALFARERKFLIAPVSRKTTRGNRRDCKATIYEPLCGCSVEPPSPMNATLALLPPVAAAGYSLLYMLFGGGLFGAIVIFVIAKMFRK